MSESNKFLLNENNKILFNEYILTFQTQINDTRIEPFINKHIKYNELTKDKKLPTNISEEKFDMMVEALKENLIAEGILIPKGFDVYPCDNCFLRDGCAFYPCKNIKQYKELK